MIKLLLLTIFFWSVSYSLKADEISGGDSEFMSQLDSVKSPFDDGLPKPVAVVNQPAPSPPSVDTTPVIVPKPVAVVPTEITLPPLHLEGVIVGEDIHQAIIDDQVVPIHGYIKGARINSVNKEGVGLYYKGKKFFLKVE